MKNFLNVDTRGIITLTYNLKQFLSVKTVNLANYYRALSKVHISNYKNFSNAYLSRITNSTTKTCRANNLFCYQIDNLICGLCITRTYQKTKIVVFFHWVILSSMRSWWKLQVVCRGRFERIFINEFGRFSMARPWKCRIRSKLILYVQDFVRVNSWRERNFI